MEGDALLEVGATTGKRRTRWVVALLALAALALLVGTRPQARLPKARSRLKTLQLQGIYVPGLAISF